MKLWLIPAMAVLFFSGCGSRTPYLKLRKINTKQARIIKQQRAYINTLKAKLKERKTVKSQKRIKTSSVLPTAPKKHIKLKKVEDNNYSSQYMYPKAKKKKPIKVAPVNPITSPTSSSSISEKTECIAMIGQEKFDKYTKMLGSETASLKRCKMLKAMK